MKKFTTALAGVGLVASIFVMSTSVVTAGSGAAVYSATLRGAPSVRFVPRVYRIANKRLRYTIKARYPQAVGADPRFAKLNQMLRSVVMKEANEFKSYYKTPQPRMGPAGSYFEANYVVEYATNDIVSVYFSIDTFGEGAAHPNHNSLTFNYDLKTEKRLKLADLFRSDTYWLNHVSNYAIEALTKKFGSDADSDWIKSGAGPEEKNFDNWTITTRGIELTFDPYQVASYAEGQHEVVIPFIAVKQEINPDGPLGRIDLAH